MILQGSLVGGYYLLFLTAIFFSVFAPLFSIAVFRLISKRFKSKSETKRNHARLPLIIIVSVIIGLLLTWALLILVFELFLGNLSYD